MPIACWHYRCFIPLLLTALGLLCSCALMQPQLSHAGAAQNAAAVAPEKMLPGNDALSGWQRSGASYDYTPGNLYTYIDGAADEFITYGFESLHGAEYACTADRQDSITVDVYDMGSALSAFGMFTSKKDPSSASLGIGAESFGNEQLVVFYKGRFYVEIQTRISGAGNRPVPQTAARMVASRIPGNNSRPGVLGLFPATGRVPGSENYVVGGILGHAFLPRGIASDYRVKGELMKAHIVLFPDPVQAGAAFDEYKKNLARSGEKIILKESFGARSFAAHEQYQKNIFVALLQNYLVCISGLSRIESGEQLTRNILDTIRQAGATPMPNH
jgi:hypothetical protein